MARLAVSTGPFRHHTTLHRIREMGGEAQPTSIIARISTTEMAIMILRICLGKQTCKHKVHKTATDHHKTSGEPRGITWLQTRNCWRGLDMHTL